MISGFWVLETKLRSSGEWYPMWGEDDSIASSRAAGRALLRKWKKTHDWPVRLRLYVRAEDVEHE